MLFGEYDYGKDIRVQRREAFEDGVEQNKSEIAKNLLNIETFCRTNCKMYKSISRKSSRISKSLDERFKSKYVDFRFKKQFL